MYWPTHNWATVTNLSATTVEAMLAVVTHFGVRYTDGTEVLVYFNDSANVISCTEIAADLGSDEE